jgi:hypothetical protein
VKDALKEWILLEAVRMLSQLRVQKSCANAVGARSKAKNKKKGRIGNLKIVFITLLTWFRKPSLQNEALS